MARIPFGGDLASYVVARKLVGDSLMLRLAPGARVAVYAQDGTTRLTDLRVGGQAVDALTADTDGQLPAWESPDGLIVSWLYLRTLDTEGQPAGALVKSVTTNPGQGGGGGVTYDDTALTQRVTALEDEPDPTWDSLDGKPAVIAAGTSATAARDAIGAGTSSLQLGVGATTAKRGDWTPTRADLDASTRGSLDKADTASQPGHTHTIAQVTNLQAELDDARSRLSTAEAKAVGATYAIRETGTGWPARTSTGASSTQTVFYFALTSGSSTPTDFVAGVDYLAKPSA